MSNARNDVAEGNVWPADHPAPDGWTEKTPDPISRRYETTLAGFTCWASEFATFATWNVFGAFVGVGDVMLSGRERTAELAKAKCAGAVVWLQAQGAQDR